jgi:flagellar hook-basal body complex protein FliE
MIIPSIGIGPLGAKEWTISPISGIGVPGATSTAAPAGSGSFGSALNNAISSLENTQATASTDAQQLATGQLSDPTVAITAVENAQLAMDFASQVRNALTTDATTIMQSTF